MAAEEKKDEEGVVATEIGKDEAYPVLVKTDKFQAGEDLYIVGHMDKCLFPALRCYEWLPYDYINGVIQLNQVQCRDVRYLLRQPPEAGKKGRGRIYNCKFFGLAYEADEAVPCICLYPIKYLQRYDDDGHMVEEVNVFETGHMPDWYRQTEIGFCELHHGFFWTSMERYRAMYTFVS